jgi:hypothetical protein
VWSDDDSWKAGYARIDPERAATLRRQGEARRARQQQKKTDGSARTS